MNLRIASVSRSTRSRTSHTGLTPLARREGSAGQALVMMVGGLLATVAVVALVVDGGNAWANQRIVQNGSDAAAEAGAVVMGQRLAGAAVPAVGWDAAVLNAVTSTATANGITVTAAYYTDICGIPLRSNGSAALNSDYSYNLSQADRVGTGLPAVVTTTPDCPSRTVGPAAGVLVLGHRDVRTYLANVVGLATISVDTRATAASGYLQESCPATQSEACAILPVAFPVDIIGCNGSNRPIDTGNPWSADGTTVYIVPLCSNGPGNVGWLDWTPTSGGTSELIGAIQTPTNPAVPLPSWQYATATGNINSSGVETAIRQYDGQVVLIPEFDLTCNPGTGSTPDQSQVSNSGANYGCMDATTNDLGGNGSNQWYRLPSFAHFRLCISTDPDCAAIGANYGAYINGTNPICNTGNGATACLIGKFVSIESSGVIGPGLGGGTGNSKAIGIQLIK